MGGYKEFINNKISVSMESGFDIDKRQLNNSLFEYQKDIVRWSLKKGRAAIFADCGLGKTLMQKEVTKKNLERTTRIMTAYEPSVTMKLPNWEEMKWNTRY